MKPRETLVVFLLVVFLFLILPVLLAYANDHKCTKCIKKTLNVGIECKHENHELIDKTKYWMCKCRAKPVASISAKAKPKLKLKPPKPATSSKPKNDYSWLDVEY